MLSVSELARFAQDSIEGRFARDVLPAIGQKWDDLPRREVSILREVCGRQHTVTLPLREPMLSTRGGTTAAIVGVAVDTPTSDRSRGEAEQRRSLVAACSLDSLLGPADETSWRSAGLLSVLAWHERMLQLIERPDPSTAPLESYPPARHDTQRPQRI